VREIMFERVCWRKGEGVRVRVRVRVGVRGLRLRITHRTITHARAHVDRDLCQHC